MVGSAAISKPVLLIRHVRRVSVRSLTLQDPLSDFAGIAYVLQEEGIFSNPWSPKGLTVATNCNDKFVIAEIKYLAFL